MYLTDEHLSKLTEIGTTQGWRFTRILRNIACFNYEGERGSSSRLEVRRDGIGGYRVNGSHSCLFQGSSEEFTAFQELCTHHAQKLDQLKQTVTLYLNSEVVKCTSFTSVQAGTMAHMMLEFSSWIDRPSRVNVGSYGLTVKDRVIDTMFSGAEDIDLAIQGGHVEVDSEPGKKATVWVNRDYLHPLAKNLVDYLTSEGFEASMSTVEYDFLGGLQDD